MSNNKEGRWITTDKGIHVFIEEGQTVEEALYERFDNDKPLEVSESKYGKNASKATDYLWKKLRNNDKYDLDEVKEKFNLTDEEFDKVKEWLDKYKKKKGITDTDETEDESEDETEEESFDPAQPEDEEYPKKRTAKQYWIYFDKDKRNGHTVSESHFNSYEPKRGEIKEVKEIDLVEAVKKSAWGNDEAILNVDEEQLNNMIDSALNSAEAEKFNSLGSYKGNLQNLIRQGFIENGAIRNNATAAAMTILDNINDEIKASYLKNNPIYKDMQSMTGANANELFNKYLKCPKENIRSVLNDTMNDCDDEGKQLFALAAIGGDITFGEEGETYTNRWSGRTEKRSVAYYPGDNAIYLNPKHDNSLSYQKGQVPFHEVFHGLDNRFGEITESKRLSNGMTLHETLKKEVMGSKQRRENLIAKINSDYVNDRESVMNSIPGYKEANARMDEVDKKYRSLFKDSYDPGWKMTLRGPSPESEAYKNSEEYKNAKNEYDKLYNKAYDAWEQINARKWGDVSDVVSGMTGGEESICSMGHRTSYWAEDRRHRVKEFFAEYCSSKYKNKESYELMNKYFPKTSKMTEEILQYMIKNKGDVIR